MTDAPFLSIPALLAHGNHDRAWSARMGVLEIPAQAESQ